MLEELKTKYQNYKIWLMERHLFENTWVRNWDIQNNQLADFGKRDSLYYTTIYLTALALEKNESAFNELLARLNAASYAKGMYPRHPGEYDVSKDPYHPFLLALTYGQRIFSQNTLLKQTLRDIIEGTKGSNYKLQNLPGSNHNGNPNNNDTTHGGMQLFRPLFELIEGRTPLSLYLTLAGSPFYSWMINAARKGYYNNFMSACMYLMFHLYLTGMAHKTLQMSVKGFASVNFENPFFLMVRDLICKDKSNQGKVEEILRTFPASHLPQDLDPITHSDMMWQRDPRDWPKEKTEQIREYSGVDFMILFQFYLRYYVENESL